MSDTSGDIIIKGGSVELIYNPGTYTLDLTANPNSWKCADKKIIQIIVTDNNDEKVYDSGENLEGLTFTIQARCS